MAGRLIGLGGKLRAGKDEVAEHLATEHDFVVMGMSDALNEALQRIGSVGPWVKLDFSFIVDKPWEKKIRRGRYIKGDFVRYTELLAAVGYVEAKRHEDVRDYLQGLGTEVGREMIDQDVWVEMAEKKIRTLWLTGADVVITAMRFPNELEMLRRMGGTSIWIDRPDALRLSETLKTPQWGVGTGSGIKDATEAHSKLQSHASENSVTAEDFDSVVVNDSSLADLFLKVDHVPFRHTDKPAYWQGILR